MLSVSTKNGYVPIINRQNFNIIYSYEGEQTLSFDIYPKDTIYPCINEKAKLKYGSNRYNVTKLNKRKNISTIIADLDLNEWKASFYRTFHTEYKLLSEVLLLITPKGWIVEEAGVAKNRRAITMEGVTAYDILMACKKTYGVVYEYHILEKKIKVIDPLVVQQRGLYMSEELNVDSVEYKGDSSVFANRLYAYGKKTETELEDGSKIVEYVTFADINDGKEYVDYKADEIISTYWQDDRYLDPQELLNDAIDKLKILAHPVQSWGCNLYDLSRTNVKYKSLNFKLYDKPVLITDGQAIIHQIVEYTDYPDNNHLNKVVLSTEFKKITGVIDNIKQSVSGLDTETKRQEYALNEITRDVRSNTLRIQNTYTKGEVDTKEESIIQQTNEAINSSVTKLEEQMIYKSSTEPEEPLEGMMWLDISNSDNPMLYTWLQVGLDEEENSIYAWVPGNDYELLKQLQSAYTELTSDEWITTVTDSVLKSDAASELVKEQELKAQLQILKDQINATLEEMSGYNLLLNSVGWNGTEFWDLGMNASIEVIDDNDVSDNTTSCHAFKIHASNMGQFVKIKYGNTYTASFMYKRYIGITNVRVSCSGIVYNILETFNDYTDDLWHEASLTFTATGQELFFYIMTGDTRFMISDIIINEGSIKKQWTQHNDEIYNTGVRIDKTGLSIEQSDTDTIVKIDSKEFAVIDKNTDEKVLRVNRDTTELTKLECSGSTQIGKLLITPVGDRVDFVIMD